MDYLIKIKERWDDFTPSDKKIGEYIIDNPEQIVNYNTLQLAEIIKTSQSAIIRFIKKIGYKGYIDFKIDVAKSLEEKNEFLLDEVISKNESIENIISKSKNNVLATVEKTYALINTEAINRAIADINKASNIYLAGVGSSGLICEDFSYKLQRSGKKVFYQVDAHTNLALVSNIDKDDLLIAISYSGLTKEILIASEYAKKVGAKVISISKTQNSALANNSNELLLIPEIEREMRYGAISSRLSSQIITDILYYGYVAANTEKVNENMRTSKLLTNKLKDN
ncbi:MurR/RpiR family transcriptional regulator [Anaerococcus provencensis]|uniref:MurR/RpiR family transcriptional regulator n=1 Tax=Anaerococcus provencensis TaxID=938293 RepID=UPI00030E54D5|nr:MurR/RpiR family transcriptional regulator [Anaerococcus provencensis]